MAIWRYRIVLSLTVGWVKRNINGTVEQGRTPVTGILIS